MAAKKEKPRDRSNSLFVTFPRETLAKLRRAADKEHRTISNYLTVLVEKHS